MRAVRLIVVVLGLVMLLASVFGPVACTSPSNRAEARRVSSRTELIGGPRALGEVGDWLLQNDQIRIIIQDTGFSRGFGVFGGSLIDADIVRAPGTTGDSVGGNGKDNFGEMFPTFFLEALEPSEVNDPNNQPGETNRLPPIEIENDGLNGEAAVLVVRGYGNDFLALTQQINEALLDDSRELPRILFETRYILRPGARYIEIKTKVQNVIFGSDSLSWDGGLALVGQPVPTPFGDVMLFGAGNKVFLPHKAGYDLRYTLEDVYASEQYSLPALPGLVADFVASTGDDVSYGLIGDPEVDEAVSFASASGQFEEAAPHSIHIPFIASAFTGVFHVVPPVLGPNDKAPGGDDEFTFRRYFVVGSGDVASVSDTAYEIIGAQTGVLSGELLEDVTGQAVEGAHVIVLKADGQKVTECATDDEGRFRAKLPAGTYSLLVRKTDRALTSLVEVSVETGVSTFQRLNIAPEARLAVTVSEPGVGRVPAKVTLVGVTDPQFVGQDSKQFLFDLSVGEPWRFTDLVPDAEDEGTRRYVEAFHHAPHGQVTMAARPGEYIAYVTRGPEYERVQLPVTLTAGSTQSVEVSIRRVVPTPGYISADFHLHSRFSLDSDEPLDERLGSYVGEGLEYVVATDHNYVVDYARTIGDLGYERFVNSAIGLELTTIDRGHFNGFPLRVGPGQLRGRDEGGGFANTIASRTYGSFQWARKTPQEVFDQLRGLGQRESPDSGCAVSEGLFWPLDAFLEGRPLREDLLNPSACQGAVKPVIVQINHPRDSILGYFEQYGVSQETLESSNIGGLFAPNTQLNPEFHARNMSWDFDAIEAFNGKRYDFLRNYTVPEGVEIDPASCCPVVPGQVFREFRRDFECDPELRNCDICLPDDVQFQVDEGNCEQGDIAFPGAIDDWMSVLRTGRRVVGTANSDSHEHAKDEPGYPRSYVAVPSDVPSEVSTDDIVAAFTAGDLLMTNGPFVSVNIGGSGMGAVVDASAEVTLDIDVRSAVWVVPNRVRVYRNAQLVADEVLTTSTVAAEQGGEYLQGTLSVELDAQGDDGFVVVEVTGDADYFPSTFPNEVPPLQFNDVLGAIGGSFGLGGPSRSLAPALTYQVTPYAMTNPIWLDADGDGEITPLVELPDPMARTRAPANELVGPPAPPPTQRYTGSGQQHFDALPVRQQEALKRLPRWLWPSRHPNDVRRVLWQFVPHAH